MGDFSPELQDVTHWPFLPALTRLGLAVAIGELLGHHSSQTTKIYTKVDLDALRTLALPWPGGVR